MKKPLKILIADDSKTDLLILSRILKKEGHIVKTSENGKEAVEAFKKMTPDIVLLDVMMPIMDGKEAAKIIKETSAENFVPVIFLTSLTDDNDLAECLDCGGDDFLSKPYNKTIINAKLRSFTRMNKLHRTIQKQKNEISKYNENLIQEQKIAKKLFDNIAHPGCIDSPNIKSIISPMSIFNGDLVLSARNPLGGMYVFVGDFTGHGLPAAIGAMPISEIFYGMTVKGFSMQDILKEINHKLKTILPVNIFCCCTMANINYREKTAEFWMAGTPDIIIYKPNEKTYIKVGCKNVPLGVVHNKDLNFSTKTFNLNVDDLIYFWTDGITEATDKNGNMFGEERLDSFFNSSPPSETAFNDLKNTISRFTGDEKQSDDISFLEFKMVDEDDIGEFFNIKSENNHSISGPMDWSFTYEIRTQTLKNFNPLPMITHILMQVPSLKKHNGKLYTILSEIYSNALEHGILELNSELKNNPNGFASYYKERNKKLSALEHGKVIFHIDHIPISKHKGKIIIIVTDSGDGFDHCTTPKTVNSYSGRGHKILKELCSNVEYNGNGNIVKVEYIWEN
jgi:CheY-like chemotaxis protein/anti-sigma regulatory factor (Ser/Thr protein kinase)